MTGRTAGSAIRASDTAQTQPMYYTFAGIRLYAQQALASYAPFITTQACEPNTRLFWGTGLAPERNAPLPCGNFAVSHADHGWIYAPIASQNAPCLAVSNDYSSLTLYGDSPSASQQQIMDMLRLALECRMAKEGCISLHGACIEFGDCSIILTGDSGMGKSTRALAMVHALGARLLSGDRPAVCLSESQVSACGVPWDGKEQVYRNARFPLKAILDIRRSKRVYIRKLDHARSRAVLLRQCFVPMWDNDLSTEILVLINALSRAVPVYRLYCGPDEADARATVEILFHHPEEIVEEGSALKAKSGFVMRNIVGENILMPIGENIQHYDGAVVLNDVSAFIWEALQAETTRDEILEKILDAYQVERELAGKDLDIALEKFRTLDLLAQ